MKPAIKKLKSCIYSKSSGPSGFFARESVQPTKQVCDHPEKKINWTVAMCANCTVYVNRTGPPESEAPPKTPTGKNSKNGKLPAKSSV